MSLQRTFPFPHSKNPGETYAGWATESRQLSVSVRQMLAHRIGASGGGCLLPTPTATDFKGAYPPTSIDNNPARRRMLRNMYQHIAKPYHSKNSQLSPRFVGEMMGFPSRAAMLERIGSWETEPNVGRVAHGVASKLDRNSRLKAIGNGQVPLTAATAWRLLMEAHA